MERTTAIYKIISPRDVRIRHIQQSDIVDIHKLLAQEGCPESENVFSDEQEGVCLDKIQERIAHRNKTDKQASADFLLCLKGNLILLGDAKFNAKKVDNLEDKSIKAKVQGSRALIESESHSILNKFFVLYCKKVLTPSKKNKLKQLHRKSPQYQFLTAEEFYILFE